VKTRILAATLVLWVETSLAAPRLDSVSVQILGGKGNDVVISVSIERATLLELNCEAVIDAGDGGRIALSWGIGDSRTKTARYEYKRAGSYRVKVAGSGKDACAGLKETTITVGTPKEGKTGAPRCPAGWILVEESVRGARYTCRARPPSQALRCAEGTSYFAERDEIGCR
jgi:hypothetical protein